jgi:serine/threonine protein kinase
MQNFILLWVCIHFIFIFFFEKYKTNILDYVSGGELFTHLNKRQHFSEQDAKIYIAELTLALGQLHKVRFQRKEEEFNYLLFCFRLELFIEILNLKIYYLIMKVILF